MAKVTISGLRKAFGAVEVIHGVDIDIADGEFVVLVGPSGCGKSTLLRLIAGLESVTAGKIAIGDRVVHNLPHKERDIAMVFQYYALYPPLIVATNIAFSPYPTVLARGAGTELRAPRARRRAGWRCRRWRRRGDGGCRRAAGPERHDTGSSRTG